VRGSRPRSASSSEGAWKGPLRFWRGKAPADVGEMVLAAVRANRLYIHTDRIMADLIEQRTRNVLEAMPAS